MENQTFALYFTVDQINVILATLAKLPYETISPLMENIKQQANMQLQAAIDQQAVSIAAEKTENETIN